MNINEMSVTELKALAYDIIGQLQLAQKNLEQVNQVIASKSKGAEDGQSQTAGAGGTPDKELEGETKGQGKKD